MSECTCPWVDPSLWTTYGSAVEPGSQREPDPECPEHGQPHRWCETCLMHIPVVDEFDDQVGYEEQAREVRVTALVCGHDIVREVRRRRYAP